MIATDNQPFTFVVAAIEPRYNLKTEKHYRTDILDGIVSKVENKIKALQGSRVRPNFSRVRQKNI